MSRPNLTEEQIRAIVRDELEAFITERQPADAADRILRSVGVAPTLRPLASLEPMHRSAVLDMMGLARYGEALSYLERFGATCTVDDVRPHVRSLARVNLASGNAVPDSPHLPGWRVWLNTIRPFGSSAADALTDSERGQRETIERAVSDLAGPVPAAIARSVDGPSGYYPSKAKGLARMLADWRWTIAPSDFPTSAHGIERAIRNGWLTTGPNIPAEAWTVAEVAA